MKVLIQKFQDYDAFYTSSVGVRKWDDIIVFSQEVRVDDTLTVSNVYISKKEFDKMVKFVNEKFEVKK